VSPINTSGSSSGHLGDASACSNHTTNDQPTLAVQALAAGQSGQIIIMWSSSASHRVPVVGLPGRGIDGLLPLPTCLRITVESPLLCSGGGGGRSGRRLVPAPRHKYQHRYRKTQVNPSQSRSSGCDNCDTLGGGGTWLLASAAQPQPSLPEPPPPAVAAPPRPAPRPPPPPPPPLGAASAPASGLSLLP
jgi:hypothetical protein